VSRITSYICLNVNQDLTIN